MNRRLKKIGTAIFDIVGFINFRLQETKGNCWIDQLYDKDYWGKNNQSKEINNEIKEYLNKGYSMGCAGRYTHEPLVDVNGEIVKIQNYLDQMKLPWNLLYQDDILAVLHYGSFCFVTPKDYITSTLFKNLDDQSLISLKAGKGGTAQTTLPAIFQNENLCRNDLTSNIDTKKQEIQNKQDELKNLQKEKAAEIERMKQEIEAKYADTISLINKKKEELESKKAELEGQLFIYDTELYAIRCYWGETVTFVPLRKGKHANIEDPVVLYQKIRFLNEELGRYAAIYDFDGSKYSKHTFEELLKIRDDFMNMFAPGPKSISLVKISKDGTIRCQSEIRNNMLSEYELLHGNTIAILIRDGENLYIGWTDDDKVQVKDENMFLKPETKEIASEDEENIRNSQKEEIAGRYFIFAILQGIVDQGKILKLPKIGSIMKSNPYVIYSMADGWLEDDRFGTLEDILKRTNHEVMKKGDTILTLMRITRDDNGYGYGRRGGVWNNNRGRGEANRTHDVSLKDFKFYKINKVDKTEYYDVFMRKYPLDIEFETIETPIRPNITNIGHVIKKSTCLWDEMELEKKEIRVLNNRLTGFTLDDEHDPTIKQVMERENAASDTEALKKFLPKNYRFETKDNTYYDSTSESMKGYHQSLDHVANSVTEYQYFISERKKYTVNSTANMEIREGEYLDMTYLNSILIRYVIRTKKVGNVYIGGTKIQFADIIPYLNKALEFLEEREKTEAALLRLHMDLYENWQVDVSRWRLEHHYHELTETRAKRFAKEFAR